MSKEISRREFLKIAGWGLSGAVAGGTAATLLDLLNPDNVQKGQFQETSTTPNAEPTVTNTSTPNINKPSSTLEPTGTTTAEKTATPESTEEPKEYDFRIGNVRLDKPFLTAGRKFFKMKATNKLWPRSSGAKMNAVDHPFGNKRSSRKSKARVAPKNAPPGRKAGMIRARRTGRKKL